MLEVEVKTDAARALEAYRNKQKYRGGTKKHMIYDFADIFVEQGDKPKEYYKESLREAISDQIRKYDKKDDNLLKDETVALVFERCKANTEANVLAKVSILNYFYSTQLKAYPIGEDNVSCEKKYHMDVVSMARHIASCLNFENWIKAGKVEAVNYIRSGNDLPSKYRKCYHMEEYSFATKYCYFSALSCDVAKSDSFPIVDTYSRDVLYYLNQYLEKKGVAFHTSIKRTNLEDYEQYRIIYSDFKKYVMLPHEDSCLSNKEIDKFLWCYGKYPYSQI